MITAREISLYLLAYCIGVPLLVGSLALRKLRQHFVDEPREGRRP